MNLEDHVGDVLRKARIHAGIALETVAAALGLTPAELEAWESSGNPPERLPNYPGLKATLDLAPGKVKDLVDGWRPRAVDLTQWRELRVITTQGPDYSVNCYLAWDEVTREAALFDTGFEAAPIRRLIQENQLDLRHIFVTHGHGDHVAALGALQAEFSKARLHASAPATPVQSRNRPGDCIPLGSLRITHRETPGHSADAVTYVIGTWPEDAPHVAVVGDAIFAGSMGRAAGQAALARSKVREQILSLPPATLICPGHGPLTTVQEEREHNPFF